MAAVIPPEMRIPFIAVNLTFGVMQVSSSFDRRGQVSSAQADQTSLRSDQGVPTIVAHRQRRVLFVTHADARCRELLLRMTLDESMLFEVAESGLTGIAMAMGMPLFDAVMISVELPDIDGSLMCTRLRERNFRGPILLLADCSSENEVVRGLDAGANDYISAPFRLEETLARLRAQIRVYESSEDAVLAIGPFQFRPGFRTLQNINTGVSVRLTEKEAAVLKFLYRADGPVTRTTLLHEVWGYNATATTHTVETHIYRLRRKIEPEPGRIELLVNVEGGYRLCINPPLSLEILCRPRVALALSDMVV